MLAASAEVMDLAGPTDMAATVIALDTPAESSSEVGGILIPGATPITTGILLITTLGLFIHRRITAPELTIGIRATAHTEASLSIVGRIELKRIAAKMEQDGE